MPETGLIDLIASLCVLFNACDGDIRPHLTIGIMAEVQFHEPVIEGFKETMADFHYVEGYIYNGATVNAQEVVDGEVKALLVRIGRYAFQYGQPDDPSR